MATSSGDREAYWPAIEKKHGLPMSHWFDVMAEISDQKYPEQVAYLRENHGFSQAHANALVMYTRGSKSSRRFASVDDYLTPLDEQKRATVTSILSAAKAASPGSEVVIAWNKPMVRLDGQYLLGVDVATHHVMLLPLSADVVERLRDRLADYPTKKKSVQVPVDWKVDKRLVADLVSARLAELD